MRKATSKQCNLNFKSYDKMTNRGFKNHHKMYKIKQRSQRTFTFISPYPQKPYLKSIE